MLSHSVTYTIDVAKINDYLFLSGAACPSSCSSVARLHLKHCPEEVLRGGCEEANLGIGMEAIEVWGLWRQFIDVAMVTGVIEIGRGNEARCQEQLTIKLRKGGCTFNIMLYEIHTIYKVP